MNESTPEGRRAAAYLNAVERLEPDLAMTDRDAYGTSAAISLKRTADAMERMAAVLDGFTRLGMIVLRKAAEDHPEAAALLAELDAAGGEV